MSDPTRIVADADVLAADLLVGGPDREAMGTVRSHDWLTLVASEPLISDAAAVIDALAGEGLAADWRERIEDDVVLVDHPPEDHPGLAAAYRGDAAHLLTHDESLSSVRAGLSVKPHADLSVRSPEAFLAVFDAAALYEATHDGDYPGPDRDPRE